MPTVSSPTKVSVKFWQGYSLISHIASWLRQPWDSGDLVEAIQLWLGDSERPDFLRRQAPNGPWTRYRVTVRTRNELGSGRSEESISLTACHADPDLISKMSLETGNNIYRRIHFGPIRASDVAGALYVERSTPMSAEFQYELVIEEDLGDCCH